MDLTRYLGERIYVAITNGFYYTGKVIAADEDSLTMIDKKGREVCLKKEIITSIEVKNG